MRNNFSRAELVKHRVSLFTTPLRPDPHSARFSIEDSTRLFSWKTVTALPEIDDDTLIYVSDVDELLDPQSAERVIEGLSTRSRA